MLFALAPILSHVTIGVSFLSVSIYLVYFFHHLIFSLSMYYFFSINAFNEAYIRSQKTSVLVSSFSWV